MTSKNARALSVLQPCTVDWATMTPEEGGRHCGTCDKIVFDLTDCTEEEAQVRLERAVQPCVRFMADMFGRPIFKAAAVVLAIGACDAAAQPPVPPQPLMGEPLMGAPPPYVAPQPEVHPQTQTGQTVAPDTSSPVRAAPRRRVRRPSVVRGRR